MKRVPIKDDKVILKELGLTVSKPKGNSITIDYGLSDNPTPADLRFAARLAYVTSLTSISVQKLSETPPFDRISYGELHRWSAEDKWASERDKYRRKIEKKLLNKLSTEHLESIVKQLKNADKLSETMHTMLKDNFIAPKSFEGMVNALMKLEEFRFSTREKVAQLLSNHIQTIDEDEETLFDKVMTPKVTYNEEALMKLAHSIIKKERSSK